MRTIDGQVFGRPFWRALNALRGLSAQTHTDMRALADMAATLVEGGRVLSRALKDRTILPAQMMLFRDYVRSVI